jgi:hypothetical protein
MVKLTLEEMCKNHPKLLRYSLAWPKTSGFDPVSVGSNPTTSAKFIRTHQVETRQCSMGIVSDLLP